MHILIAEDDPVFRSLLETRLTNWGYRVVTASDGTEALQILRGEEAPGIAILDWIMPGLDGIQLCKELRKDEKGSYTYLILVTARGSKEDIVEGMESGADDYITKPLNAVELRARLGAGRRVVRLHQEMIRARNAARLHATHDPLTGLWNRSAILELLEKDLLRTQGTGGGLALLVIDIDHFKSINDRYGPPIGDMVLIECARRIRHELPECDAIGRIGSRKFLVVLSGCGASGARETAEKVRSALRGSMFEFGGLTVPVTTSIGIADVRQDERTDWASLLRSGEAALSRAHDLGHDRIEASTSGHADLVPKG